MSAQVGKKLKGIRAPPKKLTEKRRITPRDHILSAQNAINSQVELIAK